MNGIQKILLNIENTYTRVTSAFSYTVNLDTFIIILHFFSLLNNEFRLYLHLFSMRKSNILLCADILFCTNGHFVE